MASDTYTIHGTYRTPEGDVTLVKYHDGPTNNRVLHAIELDPNDSPRHHKKRVEKLIRYWEKELGGTFTYIRTEMLHGKLLAFVVQEVPRDN